MPHLTRLNLQPHGTGSLPTPSDPESSGKSSPECPPEDRSEAPSSSSTGPEQEAGLKEVLRSGESGSRAACGTQPPSPGSPREPPPAFSSAAVAGDKSAGIAAGQPGTPMHLRERRVTGPSGASQARGLSRGWRHSYCPRGPGNGFGGFAKQVPTAIVAAVLRFQEPGRAEPGLETLRLSFRDAQGDPQGTPRCFRPAQTVWECVSLKAVSAGISTYGQPVCRGAGLSPRVFPAEGRTAEAVGCLCVLCECLCVCVSERKCMCICFCVCACAFVPALYPGHECGHCTPALFLCSPPTFWCASVLGSAQGLWGPSFFALLLDSKASV
ncbi:uncharacterized protein LOC128928101 isoform X4 [Callithrix jacchus]|uniref:uncharacterized protein LOC128928101 n=1 Tax=Callithrix jacchus TaxID=9483 RepID=UPI00084061BF|nr:uncharacterized protein LOC128928101 [Callithrix jacchus]